MGAADLEPVFLARMNSMKPSPPNHLPDTVSAGVELFQGTIVAIIEPQGEIPEDFKDVLATWTIMAGHRGLGDYSRRRLLGWSENGEPVYEVPDSSSDFWPHALPPPIEAEDGERRWGDFGYDLPLP